MGILDEAIREHLELKRQHGAGDSELKQLEDEAFGPADRPGAEPEPDPFAEAPTEFLAQPDIPGGQEQEAAGGERARREGPSIADLQEPPQPPAPPEEPQAGETPAEEQPAIEHEPVAEAPEPEQAAGHATEERHAIAEQPTELFDLEEELAAGAPPSPSDEQLIEEEIAEPRLGPADPLAGLEEDEEAEVSVEGPAAEEDEDDEFWNEQRLSDELDQALEAPVEDEPRLVEVAETEEDELEEEEPEPSDEQPPPEAPLARGEEDVLEETPDFLEETPEDDELWFEQKPPKDFDFDD